MTQQQNKAQVERGLITFSYCAISITRPTGNMLIGSRDISRAFLVPLQNKKLRWSISRYREDKGQNPVSQWTKTKLGLSGFHTVLQLA